MEYISSDTNVYPIYNSIAKGLSKDDFDQQSLCEILYPVYQSAHTMGFKEWKYEE